MLEPGKHDLIHCLGTSILEYAVLFSDIQKAVRKYHNPNLQITFDCASPFFGAAKGLAYFNSNMEHNTKWTYSMEKTAENKDFDKDMRKFSDAVIAEGIHEKFADSPVTNAMVMKDLCYRGQGFLNNMVKKLKRVGTHSVIHCYRHTMSISICLQSKKQTDSMTQGVSPQC